MSSNILKRFFTKSPIPVMVQILLERTLCPEKLNAIFASTTVDQYTRKLLFSTVFEIMNLVIFKTQPSIKAAYAEVGEGVEVSITSLYNKLNGINVETSSGLVRSTAKEQADIIKRLGGSCESLLSGYQVKMLDGNCIESSHHRISVLRDTKAGALPGKSLVIYDPALQMAVDVFPCEDGHTQERALLNEVLSTVIERDVLVMDRNFCVRSFFLGIIERGGSFVCREHKGLNWEAVKEEKQVGKIDTGTVYEQWISILDNEKEPLKLRRIRLVLNSKTRDGEKEVCIITGLPKTVADAKKIAQIYRKRWKIETMFQELESHLHSEINTLGYPKAALFGFCVALVGYNILAVVKATLRAKYGEEKIENELSGYYVAGNITRTYDGMLVAIEEQEWDVFHQMTDEEFIGVLHQLASNVDMKKFRKAPKRKRKPKQERERNLYANHNHVSTARLLKGIKPKS